MFAICSPIVAMSPSTLSNLLSIDAIFVLIALISFSIRTFTSASSPCSAVNDAVGNLVIKIYDLANFDSVNTIVYSIDSQDGATNYGNATLNLSNWTQSGAAYSYTTNFAPEPGTYHYTLQFYNGSSLIGTTSIEFTKS